MHGRIAYLPFLHHTPELVSSKVHAVEVGQDIAALDVLGDEAELAERPLGVIVVLQISQGNFEDTVLQTLGGNLGTLSPVDQCLADLAGSEHGRCLDIVPVLPCERVDTARIQQDRESEHEY